MLGFDAATLSKLDSKSAADFVQKQRTLHQHSAVFHFIGMWKMGGAYLGSVEFLAYFIGLCFRKQVAA